MGQSIQYYHRDALITPMLCYKIQFRGIAWMESTKNVPKVGRFKLEAKLLVTAAHAIC